MFQLLIALVRVIVENVVKIAWNGIRGAARIGTRFAERKLPKLSKVLTKFEKDTRLGQHIKKINKIIDKNKIKKRRWKSKLARSFSKFKKAKGAWGKTKHIGTGIGRFTGNIIKNMVMNHVEFYGRLITNPLAFVTDLYLGKFIKIKEFAKGLNRLINPIAMRKGGFKKGVKYFRNRYTGYFNTLKRHSLRNWNKPVWKMNKYDVSRLYYRNMLWSYHENSRLEWRKYGASRWERVRLYMKKLPIETGADYEKMMNRMLERHNIQTARNIFKNQLVKLNSYVEIVNSKLAHRSDIKLDQGILLKNLNRFSDRIDHMTKQELINAHQLLLSKEKEFQIYNSDDVYKTAQDMAKTIAKNEKYERLKESAENLTIAFYDEEKKAWGERIHKPNDNQIKEFASQIVDMEWED